MRQIYSIGVIIVGMLTRELRRQAIFGHMPVPWCIMWIVEHDKQAFYDSITHHRERRAWKWKELGHSPHSPGLPSVPHATAELRTCPDDLVVCVLQLAALTIHQNP